MFLDKQRDGSIQNTRVVCGMDIGLDHLRKQWRLRPIQIILPRTVRYETIVVDKVQKVLDNVLRDVDEVAAGAQQALDDPVRVPVIGLSEATSRDDKGAVHRQEAVGAVRAFPRANIGPR